MARGSRREDSDEKAEDWKCENSGDEKKRNRRTRFEREQIATTGGEEITPAKYQVVSHERSASSMERVRCEETRGAPPCESEMAPLG